MLISLIIKSWSGLGLDAFRSWECLGLGWCCLDWNTTGVSKTAHHFYLCNFLEKDQIAQIRCGTMRRVSWASSVICRDSSWLNWKGGQRSELEWPVLLYLLQLWKIHDDKKSWSFSQNKHLVFSSCVFLRAEGRELSIRILRWCHVVFNTLTDRNVLWSRLLLSVYYDCPQRAVGRERQHEAVVLLSGSPEEPQR